MSIIAGLLEERDSLESPRPLFAPCTLLHMQEEEQAEFWATLSLRYTPGLGARSIGKLLNNFGSAANACKNHGKWIAKGIKPSTVANFRRKEWKENAKKEWDAALKSSAKIILFRSPNFPVSLKSLCDTPALIYAKGDLKLLDSPGIAIVGTRNPTAHGREVARHFGTHLSRCGITIISGMAQGIDREAHDRGIAEIGKSIGVLGTGIDVIYPRANQDLYEKMLDQGLLISEFSPDSQPVAIHFPIRNRIISGLALGVLVVEAANRSGSLITARLALEQNREVFAVPGTALSANSLGCQSLVRQGARPVFCADDILRDLSDLLKSYINISASFTAKAEIVEKKLRADLPQASLLKNRPQEPVEEIPAPKIDKDFGNNLASDDCSEKILALLRQNSLNMDQLATATGLNMGELNTSLLGLEMAGKIRRLPGAKFEAL